jgi:hypothetical protein
MALQPVPRRGRSIYGGAIPAVAANMETDAMNDPNNRNPGQQREQQQREQQQRQNQQPGQQPGQRSDPKAGNQKKPGQDMNKEHDDNRE